MRRFSKEQQDVIERHRRILLFNHSFDSGYCRHLRAASHDWLVETHPWFFSFLADAGCPYTPEES